MSFVADLALGLIRGMGGPDLRDWIDNLPGKAGQELGELVKGQLDGTDVSGTVSKIKGWLDANRAEAPKLLGSLAARTVAADDASIIMTYVDVLNAVNEGVRELGRSLVLQGFFHDESCLSYWHVQKGSGQLPGFRKHESIELVSCPHHPRVYIIAHAGTLDQVRELNLSIRKSQMGALEPKEYVGKLEVSSVHEFHVKFGTIGTKEAEIPDGVPGIINMISSLAVAFEAQRAPKTALAATMASLGDRAPTEL